MATLVTDILDRAARQCSVGTVSNWLTDGTQNAAEMRDFLSETADDVLRRVDLPSPLSVRLSATIADGETLYSLPENFIRLAQGKLAVYEPEPNDRGCIPVTSDGYWEWLKEQGASGVERYYRLAGWEGAYTIEFWPVPTSPIIINYIANAWLTDGAGEFTGLGQMTVLPWRLLTSGIVWRFRERKGLPFDGKLAEYEAILARFTNQSRGRDAIIFGGQRKRDWPFDVPVPSYIPEA